MYDEIRAEVICIDEIADSKIRIINVIMSTRFDQLVLLMFCIQRSIQFLLEKKRNYQTPFFIIMSLIFFWKTAMKMKHVSLMLPFFQFMALIL